MVNHYRRMKPFLGTFVEIGINPHHYACEHAVNLAFEKIKLIHEKLSFNNLQSDLNILNYSNGQEVRLDKLSVNVIKLAKLMTFYSNHYFNCTVGNYFKDKNHVYESVSKYGSSDDIQINGNSVKLKNNITLILDGIAKGYAVDLAVISLKKSGVTFGWVNAGGDLRVFGDLTWPVHIKNINGHTEKSLNLKNISLATSNVSSEFNDRFPSQVISTQSDSSNIGTWSVVANTAWRADALTKVAANAPKEKRLSLVKNLGGDLITVK